MTTEAHNKQDQPILHPWGLRKRQEDPAEPGSAGTATGPQRLCLQHNSLEPQRFLCRKGSASASRTGPLLECSLRWFREALHSRRRPRCSFLCTVRSVCPGGHRLDFKKQALDTKFLFPTDPETLPFSERTLPGAEAFLQQGFTPPTWFGVVFFVTWRRRGGQRWSERSWQDDNEEMHVHQVVHSSLHQIFSNMPLRSRPTPQSWWGQRCICPWGTCCPPGQTEVNPQSPEINVGTKPQVSGEPRRSGGQRGL